MGAVLAQVGRVIIPNRKLYTRNSLAGKYNFHFLQGAGWVLHWPRGDAPTVSCARNIKNVKRCRDGMPKSMQTR